jgi:hypothetical protein
MQRPGDGAVPVGSTRNRRASPIGIHQFPCHERDERGHEQRA